MSDIRFDREDVTLQEIPEVACTECEEPATHYIEIDFRGAGATSIIGGEQEVYCLQCGTEVLNRIRETMPSRLNEDGTGKVD